MLGKNTVTLKDKLIAKTDKTNENTRKYTHLHVSTRKRKKEPSSPTEKVKMTFYIDSESLKKLYVYAKEKDITLTKAFNACLANGIEKFEAEK